MGLDDRPDDRQPQSGRPRAGRRLPSSPPSPAPARARDDEPRVNRSNSVGSRSPGTGGPSFATTSRTTASPAPPAAAPTTRCSDTTTAVPGGVCTRAFATRFVTTRRSCAASPGSTTGSSGTSSVHRCPGAVARASTVASTTSAVRSTASRTGVSADGAAARAAASSRASSRSSSTRSPMRRASRSIRSAFRCSATTSSDPADSSAYARTVAIGVRSSCDASATNVRMPVLGVTADGEGAGDVPEEPVQRGADLADLAVRGEVGGATRPGSRGRHVRDRVR